MKRLLIWSVAFLLTLTCGISRAESNSEESQVVTIVMNDDSDESKGLKHTLEIYPKEIRFGDVVYFASYTENTTDEIVDNFPDSEESDLNKSFVKDLKITSPQLTREYTWSEAIDSEDCVLSVFNFQPLLPHEKRLFGLWTVEFPPLEDWETPFWKELRENLTQEGIVCNLQLTNYYYVRGKDHVFRYHHEQTLTQEFLIKPRSEKESLLLEKQRLKALELQTTRNEKRDGKFVFSPPEEEDGYLALKGKEYAPSHFVREALGTSLVPDNPKTIEGWRKLDESFVEGTLRDEISFTRLLLEYLTADEGEKTEQAEKKLLDWLNALPDVQREFFLRKIVEESVSFFYQTPFADKSRALLRAVYDSLTDNYKLWICEFEKDIYHATSLIPPKGRILRPSFDELLEFRSEEIVKASADFRLWIYYGQVHKEKLAAKFLRFDDKLNQVYLETQFGHELRLDLNRFSRKDQEYILEMRDQ